MLIFNFLQLASHPLYWIGVLLALGCAFSGGCANVAVAKIKQISSLVMMWHISVGNLAIALVCPLAKLENRIFSNFVSLSWADWTVIIGVAVTSMLANLLFILASKWANPSVTAMFRSTEVPMSMAIDWGYFGNAPNGLHLVGSALVMTSVSIMPFADRIAKAIKREPFDEDVAAEGFKDSVDVTKVKFVKKVDL